MELSVGREELVRGLHLVQGVVERRTTLPILANVLLEPLGDGLALTATDMQIGLRNVVPAQVKKKGTVTVSARKLYEIVRELSGDEVMLKATQAGWVEILAGRSRFKVVSLDAKDFPALTLGAQGLKGVELEIAAGTLREMIDKTLFAVSTDDTRVNLSGVFLGTSDDGALRMVATDGHRLALVDRRVSAGKIDGVIMPRKGLLEARKLLEATPDAQVTMKVSTKDVGISVASVSFFMQLVEGEFPDYRQVIPGAPKVKAQENRDDLLAAIRRISLLASERSGGVKFSLKKGSLEVSASNPDQGEASEDVEVSYTGEPLTVGFNARYLLDVLTVHAEGDVIELSLTDEVGPGVLHGSQDADYTYVVMPMRL